MNNFDSYLTQLHILLPTNFWIIVNIVTKSKYKMIVKNKVILELWKKKITAHITLGIANVFKSKFSIKFYKVCSTDSGINDLNLLVSLTCSLYAKEKENALFCSLQVTVLLLCSKRLQKKCYRQLEKSLLQENPIMKDVVFGRSLIFRVAWLI